MSTNALNIYVEAICLPRENRAEIAERRLASWEDPKTDPGAARSSKAGIRRRRKQIREGKARLVPAEDVMREAVALVA